MRFADGKRNYTFGNFFTSGQVVLSAADSTSLTVDFPLDLKRPEYHIYVHTEVDTSEDVTDFNPENNSAQFESDVE